MNRIAANPLMITTGEYWLIESSAPETAWPRPGDSSDVAVTVALDQSGMVLLVACCWRCRGASWASRDCGRRPTQTTALRNGSSTLLRCLPRPDVGAPSLPSEPRQRVSGA